MTLPLECYMRKEGNTMEGKSIGEIHVDIKTRVEIPDDTASVCLKLAEMYCNAKGATVKAERDETGEVKLSYERL